MLQKKQINTICSFWFMYLVRMQMVSNSTTSHQLPLVRQNKWSVSRQSPSVTQIRAYGEVNNRLIKLESPKFIPNITTTPRNQLSTNIDKLTTNIEIITNTIKENIIKVKTTIVETTKSAVDSTTIIVAPSVRLKHKIILEVLHQKSTSPASTTVVRPSHRTTMASILTTKERKKLTSKSTLASIKKEEKFNKTKSISITTMMSNITNVDTTTAIYKKILKIKPKKIYPPSPTEEDIDYQQDAHWVDDPKDDNMFGDLTPKSTKDENHEVSLIRQMLLANSVNQLTLQIKPTFYTNDLQVRLRYNRLYNTSSMIENLNFTSPSINNYNSLHKIKVFDVTSSRMEVTLNDLPDGLYVVCSEVLHKTKLIEKGCIYGTVEAVVISKSSAPQQSILIVGLCVSFIVVILSVAIGFLIYLKIHSIRRAQKDRELQERFDKKAQYERERVEKEPVAFEAVYIDTDQPYEERCIM